MGWNDATDYTKQAKRVADAYSLYASETIRLRIERVGGEWYLACEGLGLERLELCGADEHDAKRDAIKVAAMHLEHRISDLQNAFAALLREQRRHANTRRTRKPLAIDTTGLHRAVIDHCDKEDPE